MKSHTSKIARCGRGRVCRRRAHRAGWRRHLLRCARDAGRVADSPAAAAAAPPAAAVRADPLGTAPNYRAIVAQNRAAVVGITTAG